MRYERDDIAIIQEVLKGQTSSYAILVDRYQAYVFTITTRYVANRETAEEIAQDVFVKAYRSLADFKGKSKFSTWLYTITVTTCLSRKRKKDEQAWPVDNDELEQIADRNNNSMPTDYENKTRKQVINEAIKRLATEDAEILTLYYLAEQTTDELAAILGMTANNVKVKLYRARQKLKEVLARDYQITDPYQ